MASASPILQAMTCFPTHTVLITWSVKRLQSSHHWTGRNQDSRKLSLMKQRQLQLVSLFICRVYQHLSLLHYPVLTLYIQFLSVLHTIRKTAKCPSTMTACETEMTSNSSAWFQGKTAQFQLCLSSLHLCLSQGCK